MSNRTLGISIAIIVLLALGVWGGIRIYNSTEVKDSTDRTVTQPAQTNTSTKDQTPMATNDCVRTFDPAKLQTAVNTKNQFVTLEVKDYGMIKVQLFDKDAPKAVESF